MKFYRKLRPSPTTIKQASFSLQQMEDKISIDVTMTHPKAKEWIVTAAKADYQELAKLSSEYPELVKLQVSLFHSSFIPFKLSSHTLMSIYQRTTSYLIKLTIIILYFITVTKAATVDILTTSNNFKQTINYPDKINLLENFRLLNVLKYLKYMFV